MKPSLDNFINLTLQITKIFKNNGIKLVEFKPITLSAVDIAKDEITSSLISLYKSYFVI